MRHVSDTQSQNQKTIPQLKLQHYLKKKKKEKSALPKMLTHVLQLKRQEVAFRGNWPEHFQCERYSNFYQLKHLDAEDDFVLKPY